ncbi:MAG: rRNA maturation RNase YbeY [bacterium]|nr:rRNA maturation RNase YbeY [bacterium]
MPKIGLEINNLTNLGVDKKFLKKIAEKTLSLTKFEIPEMSIVLVCDARMKNLNKRYKDKDKITDVLAFDYGEVIICLPQAKRQAKELRHSLKKELGILLIHGILHLAGYRDNIKKDYDKTNKKQEEIWQKITS